jgi:phosphate-selective porin OprO and OprP
MIHLLTKDTGPSGTETLFAALPVKTSVPLLLLSMALFSGCGDGSNRAGDGVQSTEAGAGGTSGAPASQITYESHLVGISNQFNADRQAQAEVIQKLLNRIERLETTDAEHVEFAQSAQQTQEEQAKALQKAHEESEQKLLGQIKELQGKVQSLEAGRVLPEIALPADDAPTTQELDQKIRIVERKGELAAEAAEARAKEAPRLSVGQNGFTLSSADTNFSLRLRGELQVDSRTFFEDNPLLNANDSFLLRRARPILEGTVFRDFDFLFAPDFGGAAVQIFDAYVNYRYRPELQLRAGKFKGPVGLENLLPDAYLSFNERSLASQLVPIRNIGVQLWGEVADGRVSYAAGVFNGAGDGRNPGTSDFNDDKEFAARVFLRPFKGTSLTTLQGLGFGLGGSYTQISSNSLGLPNTTGGTLPGYSTDGLQQFFAYNPVLGTVVADGAHWRLSPQLAYLNGPFGLLGEYVVSHQGVLNSATLRRAALDQTAWQVSAQWVLTGEPASFTGITPLRPFDPFAGKWGAWQLVARLDQLNIDGSAFPNFANPATSANSATSWGVGINWWLNKNFHVLTSFSHTKFDGGGAFNPIDPSTSVPPATVTHQDENALLTRLQLSF